MPVQFWRKPSRRMLAIGAAVTAVAALAGGGVAYAATQQPAIKTSTPRSANQVTNLDVLRQQIRNYYGDPLGTGMASGDSNYAKEVRSVEASGQRWLASAHHSRGTKAIVLDVDDTALLNWNYEVFSNWAYNPTTNATFVNNQQFPAVFGMVDLVRAAQREGYAIFYLTGRPADQEAATLGNLTSDGIGVDAGYPGPTVLRDGEDGLFTKPAAANYPGYLKAACTDDPNGACTTVHYKSATRAHLESLGYDLVANFGDQDSDLAGGHADRTFKLPNPNYYLP
ncbi:HAD family acid phosphatase [Rugosimonospora acidiphila]|uniref:HAD family acid phosphatase n=1 Tax=Rugosimonospora acidiphila TaxID=556531 RepID=A0ABP9RTJ3_9ACTN